MDMEVAPTIHQAIGVHMHWVILGVELEYQALGYIHLTQLQDNIQLYIYAAKYCSWYTQKKVIKHTFTTVVSIVISTQQFFHPFSYNTCYDSIPVMKS